MACWWWPTFFFLIGVLRFTQERLSRAWLLIVLVWFALLLMPVGPQWSKVMLMVNSLLVASLTLKASFLLRPHGKSLSVGAVQLRYVLLIHGLFYVAKAAIAITPGTLIDLATFGG